MLEVKITEVESPSSFKAEHPSKEEFENLMVDLNNYCERLKSSCPAFLPEQGDLCACYTDVFKDNQSLWYRAKVLAIFTSISGNLLRVLLIDLDRECMVNKKRLQKLDKRFNTSEFPPQVFSCCLNDLQPYSLLANKNYEYSMRKSSQWDSSAILYFQELIKDKKTFVKIISSSLDGRLLLVNLYIDREGDFINVNKVLVEKKFAEFKNETSARGTSNVNSGQVSKNQLVSSWLQDKENQNPSEEKERKSNTQILEIGQDTTSLTCKKLTKSISSTPRSSLPVVDKRRKKMKQNEENARARESYEELMRILNSDSIVENYNEISGSSDMDDMERTPVQKMSTLHQSNSIEKTKALLFDNLDKQSSDILVQAYGITGDETPKSSKKVTFSESSNKIYNIGFNEMEPGKQINLESVNINLSSKQNLDDEQLLLNSLSKSEMPLRFKQNAREKQLFSKQILLYGQRKVDPFVSRRELDLPEFIKRTVDDFKELNNITPFQSHMWPAVSSMRNIVGICEARRHVDSIVLAYTLPIIKMIAEPDINYAKGGAGNGPLLLIFVNGWQEAHRTYDIIEKLLTYYKKKIRVDVRYGGMDNEMERNIRFINGCEILVTTIPSFNKAVESGYTNVDRLNHVVFQSCSVLVEDFMEDIKIFMRNYAEFLRESKYPDKFLKQIIAIGSKWTDGMKSFMSSYMKEPLVIISNKIEMALFAKIPINVEFCKSVDKSKYLAACLELDAINKNTVIFTNTANSAENLQLELKHDSICSQVITEYTTESEFKDASVQWKTQLNKPGNVLIMSDGAVVRSGITNASFIINYEYPKKKSDFGNRLHCMSDIIKENENAEEKTPLVCHVFMTEQNNEMRYSNGLVKLLKRSGQKIPSLLMSMAETAHEMKEEEKQYSDICPRLKLFGECLYIEDCLERHTIFPNRDMIDLCPSTGFVKVLILDVISASNFWGRIIEHRLPYATNQKSQFDPNLSSKLYLDMEAYYKQEKNRVLCAKISPYNLCVTYSKLAGYQRVRIEKILERELEAPKKLEVFGIDSGVTNTVKATELFVLAKEFEMIPPQAVEIVVSCVKPVEKGVSWTMEASEAILKKIQGKTLEGRITFSLQNTIWVDPLVQKETLAGVKSTIYTVDVARDLVSEGFGEVNTKHVERLRSLLYDVLGRPIHVNDDRKSLPYAMLDHCVSMLPDDDYEDVYVSSVVHPGLFFVQLARNVEKIDKLDEKIDAEMSVKKININDLSTIFPIGYICVAKFTEDNKWYRAKIVGINQARTEYEVFYVDHGEREWLHRSRVYESWPELLTPDFEAIQCNFNKIRPTGEHWTEEDSDKFWSFVESKIFSAKVVSSEASEYINDAICYNIELFDTTGGSTVTMSHKLVHLGVAHGELECFLEMFPTASVNVSDKVYECEWNKCPDLCLAIHISKETDEKKKKLQDLLKVVSSIDNRTDVSMLENTVICICQLLALNKEESVQIFLLGCIDHLSSLSAELCNLINDHHAIEALCNILESSENENHLIQVMKTLLQVAEDSWYYQSVNNHGFIKFACHVLEDFQEKKELIKTVLDCLIKFCRDEELSCTTFRKLDGLDLLCEIFQSNTDWEVIDKVAKLFTIILSYWKNQAKMREIGGLQVLCSFVKKTLFPKALEDILGALLKCLKDNDENKNYLSRMNVKDHIEKYWKLPLPRTAEVRGLLEEIIKQLTPEVPVQTSEEILPIFRKALPPVQSNVITERKTPMTVWSQRANTITLSILIRGALMEETRVDGNKLFFRTVIGCIEYVLDLELYDEVSNINKTTMIKGGEILIVLNKLKPGEDWPRLLQSTGKFACIGIDFERWNDEGKLVQTEEKKSFSFFREGLPPPPSCHLLKGNPTVNFPAIYPSSPSSDDECSDDDDDETHGVNIGADADYLQI